MTEESQTSHLSPSCPICPEHDTEKDSPAKKSKIENCKAIYLVVLITDCFDEVPMKNYFDKYDAMLYSDFSDALRVRDCCEKWLRERDDDSQAGVLVSWETPEYIKRSRILSSLEDEFLEFKKIYGG